MWSKITQLKHTMAAAAILKNRYDIISLALVVRVGRDLVDRCTMTRRIADDEN